jgi:hypothetical protein
VNVAEAFGDPDQGNWNAAVSCAYTALHGDLSWALDLYAQEFAPNPPREDVLAKELATLTGELAFFSAAEELPSAYWATSTDGHSTRARVVVSEDEEPMYRVDAVEEPLQRLPGAHVTPQLAETIAGELRSALHRLDSAYAGLTVEDKGGDLAGLLLGAETRQRQLGWWWYRRPEPLPW